MSLTMPPNECARLRQSYPLPLVDPIAMADWSGDLEPADIREVLGGVPKETSVCIASLRQALALDDLAMARRAAHRLKGMAANLGATRLAQAAKEIEVAAQSVSQIAMQMGTLETTLAETLAVFASVVGDQGLPPSTPCQPAI
jgi:HPt (histidine-containing phosphotransfer) domain-containing protein